MNDRIWLSGLWALLGACSRDAAEGALEVDLAVPDVSGAPDASDVARPWHDALVDAAPGAGACGTVGRDLGLGLTPWPAGSVHGRLTRLETLPGALKLTLRTPEGVTATYSVTGPFDGVTAELAGPSVPIPPRPAPRVCGGPRRPVPRRVGVGAALGGVRVSGCRGGSARARL